MIVPAFLGGLVGLGLLLVAGGLAGVAPVTAPRRTVEPALDPRAFARLAVGVVSGLVFFVATGWVVGGALAGLAAVVLPRVLTTTHRREQETARSEAVAGWIEMLRDTLAGAAGLEEAIVATAPLAPPEVRPHVARLAVRVEREPLTVALRAFASDVDDPNADLAVAALLLGASGHGRDLGALLGALAQSTRDGAAAARHVEAGRARVRTALRVVVATTVGFALLLVVFNRPFLTPYDDALGQAWLLVVGASFAAALWQLDRMGRPRRAVRILGATAEVA